MVSFWHLILGVLWCQGVYKLFDDGFEKVASWIESKIGRKWCKPLFDCPPCMASVHGTILSFVFFGFDIFSWILYCFCLCGLNYIVQPIINMFHED
jgi:hypothetical protein